MTSASDKRLKWLMLLLGVGAYPSIRLVGYISVTELALLIIGPFVLLRDPHFLRFQTLRPFLWLIAVWLGSAIFSDLYRGTEFTQYARGWARVGLLGWSILIFFILLDKNPRHYAYFTVGLSLSAVIVLYYGRVGLEIYEVESGQVWENTWETSYVYIVFNAAAAFAGLFWLKRPLLTGIVVALVGCISVALGSRAFGAILILGIVTAAYLRFGGSARKATALRISPAKYVMFFLFAALSGGLIFEGYGMLAKAGYLGEKAQEKYDIQSGGRYGVILSSRSNVIGAALALRDSPVVGYGSWAEDKNGYFYQAIELAGFDPRAITEEEKLFGSRIPTHSYLLEAWVEHGLLAAFFWVYAIRFLLAFLRRSQLIDPALLAIMAVQVWLFFWNIFFSPLGNRAIVGAALATMAVLLEHVQRPSPRRSRAPAFPEFNFGTTGSRPREIGP